MLSDFTRYKIVNFLLRHHHFFLVCDMAYEGDYHEGFVSETVSNYEEGREPIAGVIASCMENRPEVAKVILNAALQHLKRYEVDCKNFIEKLYEKK